MDIADLRVKHVDIIDAYNENIEAFVFFQKHILNFFEQKSLSKYVHSVRHRLKDIDHLVEKVERKNADDLLLPESERKGQITPENLFTRINDIAGVRVLHLHISQFEFIHDALMKNIKKGEFTLFEKPKAYTWDPDSSIYFKSLKIKPELKESYYTSVHYVLRPNSHSPATCEVQIRTLLEEVWGEVDHTMNYPKQTTDEHCIEQIRVLARLVGAGTHLADSIMRRYAGGGQH